MRFKVVNTNKLRDFHCESQIQALMRAQPHRDSIETIKLPPLIVITNLIDSSSVCCILRICT
jgi:hypothetical protein